MYDLLSCMGYVPMRKITLCTGIDTIIKNGKEVFLMLITICPFAATDT